MLAETLGVTTGAVYKWESGKSIPDLALIFEMADLFGISTDVLLGYALDCKTPEEISRTILALVRDDKAEQAAAKAEEYIKKFPNDFELIYSSGIAYTRLGEQRTDREILSRGIALLERACALLPKKQYALRMDESSDCVLEWAEEEISETSIKKTIAKSQLLMGNFELGLKILRQNNVCGVNNALIGMLLADYYHDVDQAEGYIKKAFEASFDDINFVVIGYANLYFQRKDYKNAVESLKWLRKLIQISKHAVAEGFDADNVNVSSHAARNAGNAKNVGNSDEEREVAGAIGADSDFEAAPGVYDRYDCILLESIAEAYFLSEEFEKGEEYLRRSIEKAKNFDAAPKEDIRSRHLFANIHLTKLHSFFNNAENIMDFLESKVLYTENQRLIEAWKKCVGLASPAV